MKRLIVLAAFSALILSACGGGGGSAPILPGPKTGNVTFTCLDTAASGTTTRCSQPSGKPLAAMLQSAVTITTQFSGGDLSVALGDSALMQGTIANNSGSHVDGFWITIMDTIPGCPSLGAMYSELHLGPGASYNLGGGSTIWSCAAIGPAYLVGYFYNTTGDPTAPDLLNGTLLDIKAYMATHTPESAGVVNFNIVP